MNTFLKSLLMTVVVFLATTITSTGFPSTPLGWQILSITVVGTIVGYVGQSLTIPSTSILGSINLNDLLKGGIIVASNFLSSFSAAQLPGAVFSWHAILASMGAVLTAYFVKQFSTKPTGIPPSK